ncbi:hypothetical protein K438DRAFT_1808639 [Mycena galopus ATCC 62051]|nr:hypothetical protein K438DRAFT_1808639 [Mycena galopus ATCC 62051]
MPSELLAEIFACTLSPVEDVSMREGRRFDIARSPWLLTHVSSHWRAVAHSTPSLWSQIVIDCRTYPVPLVEVHIQRAHNMKIYFYADTQSPKTIQLFRLLLQHSPRWEELSLGMTDTIVPLLTAHRGHFSSLKRLWIRSSFEISDAPSLDCFQSAPLVDVGLVNGFSFLSITLPPQITRLHLQGHSWERHLGILKLVPNLVQAHLDFRSLFPAQKDKIIELPCLRRLYVSRPQTLHYLRAPALEELAIWPERGDTDLVSLLYSFVGCSACPLRRLCLAGSPEPETMTIILEKLSSITELFIVAPPWAADALVTTLTASKLAGGTMVAPQLRALFIGSLDNGQINDQAYLKMLRARWEGKAEGSALESAGLVCRETYLAATLDGLNVLREEGLDLFVLDGEEAASEIILQWLHSSPHDKTL